MYRLQPPKSYINTTSNIVSNNSRRFNQNPLLGYMFTCKAIWYFDGKYQCHRYQRHIWHWSSKSVSDHRVEWRSSLYIVTWWNPPICEHLRWCCTELVTHLCIGQIVHLWPRYWNVICFTPCNCKSQYWHIVSGSPGNKPRVNWIQNPYPCFQENAFGNVACKIAASLGRARCVNLLILPRCHTVSFPIPEKFVYIHDKNTLNYPGLVSISIKTSLC